MKTLTQLRKEIDKTDKEIIKQIRKRNKIVLEIGKIKKIKKLNIEDKNREKQQKQKIEELAKKNEINPEFLKKMFKLIITNSKEQQQKIKN
ncbi:chorismate mutase [Candidatus Woesearchaeota archaeon]|nr:chorismate mutase [Candidatus Woesearchaeota archaeon]